MTPSQEAKEYAAANGFSIEPVGRRYEIWHDNDGFVINIGGYPAALNAMRMYIPQAHRTDIAKTDNLLSPDETNDAKHMRMFADTIIGENPADARVKIYGIQRAPGEKDDALLARIDTFANAAVTGDEWRTKSADEIKQDILTGIALLKVQSAIIDKVQLGNGAALDEVGCTLCMEPRRPAETDASYRYYLMYGFREQDMQVKTATGEYLDALANIVPRTRDEVRAYHEASLPNFDDFSSEAQTRIRKMAGRIHKKPPPVTHILIFRYKDGVTQELDYPSYRAAVTGVRQVLSGLHKRYHPSYVSIARIGAQHV